MTEKNRKNNHSWHERLGHAGVLRVLRRNVILQATLAFFTIALTVVLIFSLTAAWYTNVVQTGGLDFQAEAWEFEGTIELLNQNEDIIASPGDDGVIPVRIDNNGDHIVAASATMDKNGMSEDMKKRLFFYVDTSTVRNGETMDRVYISQKSSYTYTIAPHSALELSETVKNGPLIKWMWVYDVLGYYVWGQQSGDTVTVSDYIRPVEYAYDPITTTFDANGNLSTVDGTTTVAMFLENLTKTDGYNGDFQKGVPPAVGGYYPVSVNTEGYGVWLYLCTQSEIQAHGNTDANLGSNQTACQAKVMITGANSREDSRPVSNVTELQAALGDPTVGVIQLKENLTLTDTLTMSGGSATIDLNNHSLKATNGEIIKLESGAKLSLQNGALEGSSDQMAIFMSGAHLTMNDVSISGVKTGVRVEDHELTDGSSSTVYINGGEIAATHYGLHIYGNEHDSETHTQVVVRGTTIEGTNYAGIIYNGTYGCVDTTVSDCIIKGLYAAIYHPADDSTLTINQNSKLTGGTALVVKGGAVTVSDSTIHGNLKEGVSDPAYNVSGWTDTGDGIYLEGSYADLHPDRRVSITVTDCTVTSNYGHAVRKYQTGGTNASITVVSGSFTSYVKTDVPENFNPVGIMEAYADPTRITDGNDSKSCTVTAPAAAAD